MGVSGMDNRLDLPESSRYALVLIDGLGLDLIHAHRETAPFLNDMTSVNGLSSAIPSTTSVNLTSLGTGLMPGKHGVSGYSCRIPGTTKVLNTLRWDDSIDPLQWQSHPTVYEHFARDGVHVVIVNKADFEHSGLTRCSQRGVPYVPVEQPWERTIAMAHESAQGSRSLVFGYDSSVDFAGHAFGVDSKQWREAVSTIDRDIADLRDSLPDDVILVVTADHGMVDIPLAGRFDVMDHSELMADVVVFAGEARFRHLHTKSGAEAEVAERWREALGGLAEVRLREDALEWFGPLEHRLAPRFGDVVVAALGDFGVFHSEYFAIEMMMTGFHGSITETERRIPLLIG